MVIPTAARQHYSSQSLLARSTLRSSRRIWQRVGVDFDAGWARWGTALTGIVVAAQVKAATEGAEYLPAVLAETWQDASGLETIAPAAFAGVNRWGAPVDQILRTAVIHAKQAVAAGYSPQGALMQGRKFLDIAVPSLLADADRGAVQAGITTTRTVGGYVRMTDGDPCRRCIVLAGRWYRWNQGFERHPKCGCRHIPAAEAMAGDMATDPYAAFDALSKEQQDARFGKADAQAIRDGADIYQVVNTRQRERPVGMPSGRMTLDDIYAEAGGNRARAVQLMRREGYIVGPQEIRQRRERFATPSKRPVVAGSARDRVLQARATGVRDPLDRATMTAQERRLFDAVYRQQYALRNGYIPRSIGPNSADAVGNTRGVPATQTWMDQLDADVQRQLSQIRTDRAESGELLRLADALGLNDDRADIIHERIWQQMQERFAVTNGFSLKGALRVL